MKRIDKSKAMPVVLALMLVLSTVFYVGLRPTTAWFHEETDISEAYTVGTFQVNYDAYSHRTMNLTFDATTKIDEALANDAARNKEFEYAVQYLYVTVENNVESARNDADYLDALVKLKFGDQAVANGLRYYYFVSTNAMDIPESTSHSYYAQAVTDENGWHAGRDLASKIRTFCGSNSITTDAGFISAAINPQRYVQTNETGFSNGAIRVPHNQQVTICIALWVDHGSSGVTKTNFSTELTLYAQQAKTA